MSTRCGPPNRTLKTVLDTCVLKLATLPNPANKSAVIVELCLREALRAYVTPDVLGEYQRVLGDCQCALACRADYLVTVNTARGHFDRKSYGDVRVATPGNFLQLADVQTLLRRLAE